MINFTILIQIYYMIRNGIDLGRKSSSSFLIKEWVVIFVLVQEVVELKVVEIMEYHSNIEWPVKNKIIKSLGW